jgi:putative transposase
LTDIEREKVRELLNSQRFCDKSPREIWATLLDQEQVYLCSWRTMYRILDEYNEVKERRQGHQRTHYKKPELLATGPNQVWSWDITKLKGPATWSYFYLYAILDIYSRYVVGWMVAEAESSALACELIETTVSRQNIEKGALTLHADRGSSMKSKSVAQLLVSLGILKSHSRPHTSDDNPFSEAQFKTLKYHHSFPDRFGCIQDARVFCAPFFDWYNQQHHHTSIGLLTPHDLHSGRANDILDQRHQTMSAAYDSHPERFVHGPSPLQTAPDAVWINPPPSPSSQEHT